MESCGGLTERVFRAWKEPNSHKNLHTNKIDVKEIDGNNIHHKWVKFLIWFMSKNESTKLNPPRIIEPIENAVQSCPECGQLFT